MEVNIELLNEEIHKKGWSINKLATESGVDKATISRLLNGSSCSIITAQKLVIALDIPPAQAGLIFFGK